MQQKFMICLMILFAGVKNISGQKTTTPADIRIEWVNHLDGDFSFTEKWSYHENVFRNEETGQLVCDGFCIPEMDAMRDSTGWIIKDSMEAYYKLLDTSHQYHTILCDAWSYEWAGTDFFAISRVNADTFTGHTFSNVGTHCSLRLMITKTRCLPVIYYNGVCPGCRGVYPCSGGNISIDKELWAKGVMKATFNFTFENTDDKQTPMFWKGNIYCKIDKT